MMPFEPNFKENLPKNGIDRRRAISTAVDLGAAQIAKNNTTCRRRASAAPSGIAMSSSGPSKAEEISLVLSEPEVDLWKLRELALTEGGLVNDTLRKRAWPKLVGLHGSLATATSSISELAARSKQGRSLPPLAPPPFGEIDDATATTTTTITTTSPIVSTTPAGILPPSGRKGGGGASTPRETNNETTADNDDDDDASSSFVSISSSVISMSSAISDDSRWKRKSHHHVIAESLDANQIERDVARCTWHLLTGSQRSRRLQMQHKHRKKVATLLKKKQRRLGNLINLTLVQSYRNCTLENRLRYYQGYHDVACIFLSALGGGGSGPTSTTTSLFNAADSCSSQLDSMAIATGLDLPSRVLLQVSRSHFRDAMRSNFCELQNALRLIVMPLIGAFDSQVHAMLWDCDMEPYFLLSWIITWFSHDIRDTDLVKRLFDAFLSSHALFCIYLSVAMVCHATNRSDVLTNSEWGDFASVHSTLASLPKNSCSVGWKYKVGDGYVSGDEEEEDGTTRSTTDMEDVASLVSEEEKLLNDLVVVDEAGNESMISSNNLMQHVGSNTRVPFQELIDLAITYMRQIPPRNLIKLARRYHVADEHLLAQASSIALLQPPPSWGLVSTTPSDWVLKQRARESRGMSSTSRKDRKRRRQQQQQQQSNNEASEREIVKYLEEKNKTLAVIASGYGPGDEDERRWRRRKKRIMQASVLVAVVAIAYGVTVQYRPEFFSTAVESDRQQSDDDGKTKKGRNMLVKNATASAVKKVTQLIRPNKTSTEQEHVNVLPSLSANISSAKDGSFAVQQKLTSSASSRKQQSDKKIKNPIIARAAKKDPIIETHVSVDNTPAHSAVAQRRDGSVLRRASQMYNKAAKLTTEVMSGKFQERLVSSVLQLLKNLRTVIEDAIVKP